MRATNRFLATAAIGAVLVGGVATPAQATGAPQLAGTPARPAPVVEGDGDGTGLWIVRLAGDPLATYTGGVRGLAPTSPRATRADRLDVDAAPSVSYLDYLAGEQERFTVEAERALGRELKVAHAYRNVVNGLALRVSDAEAEALARLPQVVSVHEDEAHEPATDTSHDLIRSAEVWAGATGTGVATRGEGVVVGMLDSGVNPDHPSFAATDGEGYTHTNPLGSGNYLGVCDPQHPRHDDICNDKLIGAWSFYPGMPTARDWFGHGSHVGSTIAGNVHQATFTLGSEEMTQTIQGVAPRANVISYQICLPTCPESATIAAVDQAIADPTQVLNYSIEGTDNPWGDIVSLAFLDAFNAGIFVAASAGNSGPQAGTAAKTAPWNASVAAANHRRAFGHRLEVAASAGDAGFAAVPGSGPALTEDLAAPLHEAGSGCTPYGDGALAGAIALVDDTECRYRVKVNNAASAGASAVVVATGAAGPPTTMGGLESTTIPSVMVERSTGATLRDLAGGTVEISAAVEIWEDDSWAETVASFSSRGPSRFELLAPTLAAPGVGVLAASAPDGDDPEQYLVASGTSMASPHVAGAGALLLALHPDWSPAQVRSALGGTAQPLAGDPFDGGAGMLDVAGASRAGLVLDETYANFVAANPGAGGDPKQLNVPSLVEHGCAASCTWVRTLTNVAGTAATYTATAQAPSGITVTVSPSEFTLDPGAEQAVRVTVDLDPTAYPVGEWAFASVGFATGATSHGQPVAPVSYPITVQAAEPDQIALTAGTYRSRVDYHAELTWSGATSEQVDIHRDGELVATVDNYGRYVDDLGRPPRGTTYTYQVCRLGSTAVCSDEAAVEIDPLVRPAPHPRITTTELPGLHVLEGYQHTLLATGGSGEHRWEATGLPDGLVLDATTGVLRRDVAVPLSVPDGAEVTVSVQDAERPGPVSTATFALDAVGVDQVAAGWGHTCAIDTEQAAYCWGRDATGQIGRGVVGGDGVHVPHPVPVLDVDGKAQLTGITQIDGGDGHTCALTTEGTVYCWGANFDGRLGDGDPSDPKPVPVAVRDSSGTGPLTGVVEIAVGWQFACAVTVDEQLYCWGNNRGGKLGIGGTGGVEPLPVAVRDTAGEAPLTGVTTVAAAAGHACAVAGGTPYCWGGNYQGQLGTGETSAGSPLPVPVAGDLSDVAQLAAGPSHSCAVTAGGTAYCWGGNWASQLGRGTDGGTGFAPAEVLDPDGAAPLSGVVSVATGGNHTCALTGTGAAHCWGAGSSGQTGHGVAGGPDLSLPVEVRDPTGDGTFPAATSLATGSEHSCAVSASLSYCWGANFNRQLGIGQTIDAYAAPLPMPTRPGAAS